ncbi:hypothetical protein [Croceivirga sp. JEA036]|uniref:hypothetical protein n=1 Tax=Croceivirga sp. JEA036 TaxID=2721162 RepID=UPI00143B3CBC|nr:hypothetical protein [Croceivirga sp. JEA036]NJB35688.1 hypothetical protein [Croceivirga sp. JEA036]
MIFCKKTYVLSLALLMAFFGQEKLLAQELEKYNGLYKTKSYVGKAAFSYTVTEKDTIFNGPFSLQRSSLDALVAKEDNSFLIKGNFNQGTPEGKWLFQFGEFKSNRESEVVDYQYRVLISGIQEEAKGLIAKGVPDGEWTITAQEIENSEQIATLFESAINFEAGIPQQGFSISDKNSTLVGRFLRDGLAHDDWSLFSSQSSLGEETWKFKDGVLVTINKTTKNGKETIPIFDFKQGDFKTINLDKNYLKLVALYEAQHATTSSQVHGMEKLLAKNADYYAKIDGILTDLGNANFKPEFKVKVPYFKMDSTQHEKLDNTFAVVDSLLISTAALLADSHLNILKRSNEDAMFHYNVLERLQQEYLLPLKELSKLNEQGLLNYISPKELYGYLFSADAPQKEFLVMVDSKEEKKEKAFVLNNADGFDFNGENLEAIFNMYGFAKEGVNLTLLELQKILRIEKGEQELVALEEGLIAQQQQIEGLLDSLPKDKWTRAIEDINKKMEQGLTDYAKLRTNEEKLSFAHNQKQCNNQLLLLANQLAAMPMQQQIVEKAYLDPVWNPFMATVMEEEVKKRITVAYKKVLLPYFIETTKASMDCNTAAQLAQDLEFTHKSMLQLREKETKKLEKKLKRENNPKTVLQLFHQFTNAK